MTSDERALMRDSLGLTSFRASCATAPPPPTLRTLKLDFRTDPYGLLVKHHTPTTDVGGGFALLHQLFDTDLVRPDFNTFLHPAETYPLQTRVGGLQELELSVGTQFYSDMSLMWPAVCDTLTRLAVHLR